MKTFIIMIVISTVIIGYAYFLPRDRYQTYHHRNSNNFLQPIKTISIISIKKIPVIVTIYNAVESQTDSTPHILADGTHIDVTKISKYRYCALSRNLLKRWGGIFDYGDTIHIYNVGHLSGLWIVKDTMNKRWENRVDLLCEITSQKYKFKDASIVKIN